MRVVSSLCTVRPLLFRVETAAVDVSNTEFLSPAVVQGQCAPGPTGAVFGGEPPGGVLATAPVVVATSVAAMNQLGTVYATKRRRRNGKRYVKKYMINCYILTKKLILKVLVKYVYLKKKTEKEYLFFSYHIKSIFATETKS